MTTELERFMDQIRSAPVPLGFGLIFVDARRHGTDVIQIDAPRFAWPLPLDDAEGPLRLLVISPDIAVDFVSDLKAVPVESMGEAWFRFGIWEENVHSG